MAQRIRVMEQDDLQQVLAWRNSPSVRRFMYTQHKISLAEHTHWFERASLDCKRHLLIFEQEERAQGFISFHEVSAGGIADWGFYTAPDAPKGTGKQLGISALMHAFARLGLHKICGQALAFNERSIQFHLRLGFRQEGILREQYFDGEKYHSVTCFGLLANEWQVTTER
ncbi:UDP-4-amino-4,6-dideoxy-N-acetyl-beta-L-altrosamine N-acetyltransferase [Pseudomaricurvus albidus]|uniref:UDP-4-amino-4, 6-dideoxy-N-acetyl-beta-L-altrosamine N-acetyltransferase n=1 Tax=Pseudomaricurvus albidus TaxID=2842452 RepID=UPI001F4909E0|nr:UDP-4-amino-4,6-dideoxy-N-acetyl-beta-L-altrosamine N-acetyltransferase [Aestuariicella albida]